jgi:hypothetical protein
LGTFVLLFSVYLISQGKVSVDDLLTEDSSSKEISAQEKKNREKMVNSMMAIITAFTCILFFSFRDFLLRYYKVYKDYPAFELSLDSLTLYSFCCVIFSFIHFGL